MVNTIVRKFKSLTPLFTQHASDRKYLESGLSAE